MKKKEKKVKIPTAKKREIQNVKRNLRNRSFKSSTNTAIKNFKKAVENKDREEAKERLNIVFSLMDKGVKRNIFKKNKAARIKHRLSLFLKN